MVIIAKSVNQSCRYDPSTAWKVPASSAYFIRNILNQDNWEVDECSRPVFWEVYNVYEGQEGYAYGSTRHIRLYKGRLVYKYDGFKEVKCWHNN